MRVVRWTGVAVIVLAVGVAGAATKLKQHWSAGDACLCTPDTQDSTDAAGAIDPARTSAPYTSRKGTIAPSTSTTAAGPLVTVPVGGSVAALSARGSNSGARVGMAGWSNGWRNIGAYSSSGGSGRSASLGGLWRLMSLSHHAPRAESSAPVVRQTAARTPRTGSPRAPGNGSGGSSSTRPPATTPTTVPAVASDLFAEQATPIPALLSPGGPQLSAGGSGGGSIPGAAEDPGALAATPEPASLFLIGTGLLGIAGLLRRRLI